MEPEATPAETKLPFNNLYLNAGFVNGLNKSWIYFLGTLAVILGYLSAQILMLAPLLSCAMNHGITFGDIQADPNILFDPDKIGMNKNILLAFEFSMFVFAFLGLLIVIKRVHRKTLTSVITAYDKIRFNRFFFAFFVWSIFIVISTLVQYFIKPEDVKIQFDPFNFVCLVFVCVVFMPIQTGTEELFFRGYLIQGISQTVWRPSWLLRLILRKSNPEFLEWLTAFYAKISEKLFRNAIVPLIITSILFGSLHMTNPEAKAYGWVTMLPYYSVFGFFLGAIALLDEGLELPMGIHCANNLISSLLVTSPNGVLKTDAIFVTATENPGTEFLTWIVMALLTFIIFWQKYRWKNFNLLIK